MAPVAFGIHVAQIQTGRKTQQDTGQGTGDLAGYKSFATHGGFMIEKNAVAGVHAVGFAVVDRDPVRIELRTGVG